jgi:hypothetical protein
MADPSMPADPAPAVATVASRAKKLKFHLQLWDGLWSIPVTMGAFCGVGLLLQWLFTNRDDPQGGPGFYDPSYLQAGFYASAMQVFINSTVFLVIYFNFRRLRHYLTGRKDKATGVITNDSKIDFDALQPWQRLFVLFAVYFLLSAEWIVIWVHLK